MSHPGESALLVSARTRFEAKVISGVLASAGVTVVSNFDPRHDEFAVAQSIMNLSGVDVYVSQDHFDQAKRVLTEARASGRAFEADRADDPNGL